MSENEGSDQKGNEPGWNDPPYFSYEHTNYEHKNKSGKMLLNKRVVHTFSMPPAGRPHDQSPPPILGDAPPRGSPSTHIAEGDVQSEEIEESEENIEISLSDTLYNFMAALEDIKQENEKDFIEIKRRLDILEKMWIDGSFPKDVQKKIHSMSTALAKKDEDEVNRYQRILMVDHSRLCSSWMAAIRKLISAKLNSS